MAKQKPAEWYLHYTLKCPWWLAARDLVRLAKGRKCEWCGSEKNTVVHHKTYERLGQEDLVADLAVLCGSCHFKAHRTPVPFEEIIHDPTPPKWYYSADIWKKFK